MLHVFEEIYLSTKSFTAFYLELSHMAIDSFKEACPIMHLAQCGKALDDC